MSKKPAAAKQAPQPVLSLTKTNDMNMLVLKRIDSQIEEILATAGQVCLYRMSVDDQQWQRKNIEGSLFLIKRRSQPRFQMLVLNKLSTDNYIETVHGGLEMETNPPYLMYTHGNDEIHGIWFYDENDLQRLSSLLHKILNQLPKPDAADPASKIQLQSQHASEPAAPTALAAGDHQYQQHLVMSPQEPAAVPAADGDAFWDRSVQVTEDTLPNTQQLVPNSSLLAEQSPAAPSSSVAAGGGLQGLLKAAQQKHSTAQQQQQQQQQQRAAPPQPVPVPVPLAPSASVPIPNSTSMPPEPSPSAAGLLTPAFFEQQKARQAPVIAEVSAAPSPAQPNAAPAGPAADAAVIDAAGGAPRPAASVVSPAASNGTGGANALHKLLSRAAKHTSSPGTPPVPATSASTGAAAAAHAAAAGSAAHAPSVAMAAAPRGTPQPPLGVLSPEVAREKVKAMLIRLANNEGFVDMLAQEMRTVGLLQ